MVKELADFVNIKKQEAESESKLYEFKNVIIGLEEDLVHSGREFVKEGPAKYALAPHTQAR